MTDKAEKDIRDLTDTEKISDSALTRLLCLSKRYAVIDAKIQGILSPRLQGQVRLACIEQGQVILAAYSPAWVSRTQLESQEILKVVRGLWDEPLSGVKVIVNPNIYTA